MLKLHCTEASFGAQPVERGVRFRVWAPAAGELVLLLHDGAAAGRIPLTRDPAGMFEATIENAAAGERYSFVLDGSHPLPDPASRFQPDGVHGPSQIVDPAAFRWSDDGWAGPSLRDLIVYELHVGAFSPEGTFDGVRRRLPRLRDLGITAIELMPVADFPGARNWGYDGVALYAPSRAYGTPDDLRALVNRAHAMGISVLLDVVYNHLGPEGAWLPSFNPQYLTGDYTTPWGRGVNLSGPGSEMTRRFIVDNAQHWIREYHMDGLRIDATHALVDDGPRHIVAELAAAARVCRTRPIVVHAEDHRNLSAIVEDVESGGWGLDGVWADDFHHVVRRRLAGDSFGYYGDFTGDAGELAAVLRQGWLFTGQRSPRTHERRGTDPSRVPMARFVVCLQNHDQIGNRARGDRLHHSITPEAWRAASAVLLTSPMTPLLFMGQEWAASSPFQYFTDHSPELGQGVTDGRRREFAEFPEFSGAAARAAIPDPQAASTFEASRLQWEEREEAPHAGVLALHRALIALRRTHPALAASEETAGEAVALDAATIVVRRGDRAGAFWIVAKLRGGGAVDLASREAGGIRPSRPARWEVVLTTEDAVFAADAHPLEIGVDRTAPVIRFTRPGAVILREHHSGGDGT